MGQLYNIQFKRIHETNDQHLDQIAGPVIPSDSSMKSDLLEHSVLRFRCYDDACRVCFLNAVMPIVLGLATLLFGRKYRPRFLLGASRFLHFLLFFAVYPPQKTKHADRSVHRKVIGTKATAVKKKRLFLVTLYQTFSLNAF